MIVDVQGRLKHGKIAAIKVLSAESRQGVNEFLAEIKAMSEIEHENLVKLYGCCVEDNHRILVYNYLENNSLAQTLLDGGRGCSNIQFSWRTRTKICIGAWELFERRELVALVDESLNGDFDAEEACRVLNIGLLCTQDDPNLRPSMSTVVKMLTGLKNVDERKITRPGLISDFLDVKVRAPYKITASATTSSDVSLMTSDNSLSTSEKSSRVTSTGFHGSI
ncbi:hypothetical protein DKX38_026077 [Salix brachista]|uniref:Protein kinase domain-containing protein n=1 Tax=Salix brachista TaxID=2182728 RepID=A0A5N5JQQ9_9ROSI|nr:hypothetical protein DKX38_026077 [Salix brachista]